MQGIGLTTIAIIISIVMLLLSTFLAIEKKPTKVQVVNSAKKQTSTIATDTLSTITKKTTPQK